MTPLTEIKKHNTTDSLYWIRMGKSVARSRGFKTTDLDFVKSRLQKNSICCFVSGYLLYFGIKCLWEDVLEHIIHLERKK